MHQPLLLQVAQAVLVPFLVDKVSHWLPFTLNAYALYASLPCLVDPKRRATVLEQLLLGFAQPQHCHCMHTACPFPE